MSTPYIGEIVMFGGNFAPRGWALCNGQLLSIQQNAALFSILGTTFGGNGTTNFGLPNMQGRLPMHPGNNGQSTYVLGEMSGAETVSLNTTQLPSHNHALVEANAKMLLNCSTTTGNQPKPAGQVHAGATGASPYGPPTNPPGVMNPTSVTFANGAATNLTGSNIPFSVVQPFLGVNFIIALVGLFPSRN